MSDPRSQAPSPRTMNTGELTVEVFRLREALTMILRTSNDGESMLIAAEALGIELDRTEG